MQTYFCPQCGRSLDASECEEHENLFLRCPDCPNSRVIWRGRVLIGTGLIISFGSTLLPIPYIQTLGIVIGGSLCVTGLIRSIRQRRAQRALRDDESDFPDEPFDDFDEV